MGTIHGEGTRAGKRAGNGVNAGEIVKALFGYDTDPLDGLHGPGVGVHLDMHEDGAALGNANGRDAGSNGSFIGKVFGGLIAAPAVTREGAARPRTVDNTNPPLARRVGIRVNCVA
ncbi:MAG: hypothetical protein WC708_14725 [Lentisphaeria bacterium]